MTSPYGALSDELEGLSGYDAEVVALQAQIAPLVPAQRPEPIRWIVTPGGDLGTEWCSTCGYYMVRHLKRHDRLHRDDYILDGGWRIESDNYPTCEGCGQPLDVIPTDYCIQQTIQTFQECGYSTSTERDAFEIDEMLDSVAYCYAGDRAAKREQRRNAIIAIARQFIRSLQTGNAE